MDMATGLKIIKEKLDSYEIGYYEYGEILQYVVVFIVTSNVKGHEITKTYIEDACEEGMKFMKKYVNGVHN